MCEVFLSRFDDQTCSSSRLALLHLIELRPNDKTDIIKSINENYPDFVVDLTNSQSDDIENDVEQQEEDEWYTHDKKNSLTLKNASPFTKVFENIQKDRGVENESGDENLLYNPDFIQFLQNFFYALYLYMGRIYF